MKLYRRGVSYVITPLLLLQVGIVVIGSLAVKITMKLMGYNGPDGKFLIWSDNCLFVRNWEFLLLLIPASFLYFIVRCYNHDQSQYLSKKLILICAITTLALLAFIFITYLDANSPYHDGMINAL